MAIVLDEATADQCCKALEDEPDLLISAGTIAEALIVAGRRGVHHHMTRLIAGLGVQIIAVTAVSAQRMGATYLAWGQGDHPASLNFGDCFADDAAKEKRLPAAVRRQGFLEHRYRERALIFRGRVTPP
jgi:ribonuclease VapC